jgi:hypothetical protein
MSINGASFLRVGTMETNWYNSFNGWQGSSGGGSWIVVNHLLTGAGNQGAVRVRVRFYSDGSGQNEGVGIDDLRIMSP